MISGIHITKNDEKHMPEAMEGVLGSKNDLTNKFYRDLADFRKKVIIIILYTYEPGHLCHLYSYIAYIAYIPYMCGAVLQGAITQVGSSLCLAELHKLLLPGNTQNAAGRCAP